MLARFRGAYGTGPLHLLALSASLLIAGAAVAGWLDNRASIAVRILIWFLGAILAHDLVLLPLYSLLDRIAFGSGRRPRPTAKAATDSPGARAYLRIPAILSALLFLVFFPEILRLGDGTFHAATGLHQEVYLPRFLLACGAMFALSGLAYAVSLRRRAAARAQTQQSPRRIPPAR